MQFANILEVSPMYLMGYSEETESELSITFKKELGNKLRTARINSGFTQQEAAEITGIKYKTISDYENGKSRPDVEKLSLLCMAYNISADYFINVNLKNRKESSFSQNELSLLSNYCALDIYGQKTVRYVIESEQYRMKEQKKNMFMKEKQASYLCSPVERNYPEGIYALEDFKDEENRVSMPVYDFGVSAGTGVFLDNPCYEVISMPEDRLSRKANFALWVIGDSMEPRFHDGDLVLVKIQPSVEPGEIGIFVLNGEGYIKKFGGDKLISLNPVYEPIIITEDDALYCKGKVIGNA